MAVEKLTPERRRQLTRDTLIDAATQVFVQRGFHAASLEEIAEVAGFTRGAIYKNFADKEDLFFAVSERLNERMLGEFSDLIGKGSVEDFSDTSAAAAKWRELQARDLDFLVLGTEFNLYLLRNPEARARAVERRHEGVRRIAHLMHQTAEAAGVEMPLPVEDLATIFVVTSDGFTMASLIDPEVARLYEPFLALFTRGAFGPPQPGKQ